MCSINTLNATSHDAAAYVRHVTVQHYPMSAHAHRLPHKQPWHKLFTRRQNEHADASMTCCRSWEIGKKGELNQSKARQKAHQNRVTAITHADGFLYSVSWDGSVKMWDASTMELVMAVSNAHGGGRVHCLAVGADGYLYTGGDDKVWASAASA